MYYVYCELLYLQNITSKHLVEVYFHAVMHVKLMFILNDNSFRIQQKFCL